MCVCVSYIYIAQSISLRIAIETWLKEHQVWVRMCEVPGSISEEKNVAYHKQIFRFGFNLSQKRNIVKLRKFSEVWLSNHHKK